MIMKPARFGPERLEGRPFVLRDLHVAMAWAAIRPSVRLRIMLDYAETSQVIEIYSPAFASPRWFIWNTSEGGNRVDDWAKAEFGLPYLTIDTALRFIGSTL
jgi:hypothetical protein